MTDDADFEWLAAALDETVASGPASPEEAQTVRRIARRLAGGSCLQTIPLVDSRLLCWSKWLLLSAGLAVSAAIAMPARTSERRVDGEGTYEWITSTSTFQARSCGRDADTPVGSGGEEVQGNSFVGVTEKKGDIWENARPCCHVEAAPDGLSADGVLFSGNLIRWPVESAKDEINPSQE